RRRHTIWPRDWSSDVCSSDLDDWYAETLQLIDEAEQLIGGAALRQDDADVVPAHDAEVAVQRIDGMQEHGRGAGGCERRSDLARSEERRVGKEWDGWWWGDAG